jgi:hypothetical protein
MNLQNSNFATLQLLNTERDHHQNKSEMQQPVTHKEHPVKPTPRSSSKGIVLPSIFLNKKRFISALSTPPGAFKLGKR